MSLPLRPEVQALVRIRPVFEKFAHSFVPGPGCSLDARFYQAEPAPVVGTTKCPESLCLMSALPPSGRRVPSPPRTLLLGPRSYRLIRQSRVALLYFGLLASFVESSQVATSPCCQRDLPDVILRIFPQMPGPMSRRSHRVHLPVSSSVSSAFPWAAENWLPASIRETTFPRESFRDCRHFFMFKPPSLLASQVVPTAVHTATGQLRLLGPGRTCFVASARTGHANRPNTGN